MTNEELQAKYQSLLDLCNQNGWQYNLSGGDDGVLHVDVNVPDDNAKQQVWDKYGEIDPGMDPWARPKTSGASSRRTLHQ